MNRSPLLEAPHFFSLFKASLALVCLLAGLALPAAAEDAEGLTVNAEESVFAVLTHKAGLGARLAHNHLVVASDYKAQLTFGGEAESLALSFEVPAEKLLVDRQDLQAEVGPRLQELGLLDEAFGELSDKDRGKIRESMLSKGQLDAAAHPLIKAEVKGVQKKESQLGEVAFPYALTLALTVRGKTVEKPAAARYTFEDGRLQAEAVATFQFTDFGIEPYSAFLGAVKNEDEFEVYVKLSAGF